jgi:hypothetical protein
MRASQRWAALTTVVLGLAPETAANAQTVVYAGAGIGYTAVLDHGRGSWEGNRNWFGMAGLESGGPLGGRLAAAETMSRLWVSADVTYRLSTRDRPVRPYAVLGGGFVLDLSEIDPLLALGMGLRVQIGRLVFLFSEARLQWVPSMPATSTQAKLILPLTAGVGIGY